MVLGRNPRKLLWFVATALAAVAAPVSAAAIPVQAGSRLFARLDAPISTGGSGACVRVRAVLTGASQGESFWTAPAGIVLEGFAHTVRHTGPGRRALLDLRFDRILIGQTTTPANLRLLEVDNVSVKLNDRGLIQGRSPWTNRRGKVEDLLLVGSPAVPLLLIPWAASKVTLSAFLHPRIRLQPGTELTLATDDAMEVPGLSPVSPDTSPEAGSLLGSQPLQASAHNGRHASDLMNVAIIGNAEALVGAFEAAGWSRADPLSVKSDAKVLAILAHPHSYKKAPVSTLFLEGRPPDLVFEKQNDTFAKRHHVRFWLQPSANQGRTVWLGAATHDIGIAFRRRIFGFTHVVHTQIDEERSRVVLDLAATGWVNEVSFYDRANAIRHARNATGDHLETDGRLAFIKLRPFGSSEGAVTNKGQVVGSQQSTKP